MAYAVARMEERQHELIYRYYMTDTMKIMGENMANAVGGSYLSGRFYDLLHPSETDERTGDEIVRDVLSHICRTGGGDA